MSGQRRRRSRSKGRKSVSPAEFWGDPDATPPEAPRVVAVEDPTAMVRSLGPAPLAGRENVSQHYFAAVYERAAMLAGALAATAGLLESESGDEE
jgi:hypothetical protein